MGREEHDFATLISGYFKKILRPKEMLLRVGDHKKTNI